MLARAGLAQRVVVHARHYAALPELVASTDVVAIVPRAYARALEPRHDIRAFELPGQGAPYEVRMVWHESATQDSAHAWLRALVRERIGPVGRATAPRRGATA
jgi:DNA-binding transcriptional LysR family regulator